MAGYLKVCFYFISEIIHVFDVAGVEFRDWLEETGLCIL